MIADRALGFVLIGFIHVYRRFLSLVKGFRCPHHLLHGMGSCSDYGLKAFRNFGFVRGWRKLNMRLGECKEARMTFAQIGAGTTTERKKKDKWYDSFLNGCSCDGFDCSW